jgi:serine/threonine-protein kinase
MSPEQCRGRDVDHRTDIYAFGCVTYKLLTGTVPFDGDDYMTILMKQISDPVPSAAALAPELPASVDQVIAWMMAKDPAQRPASVVGAVRALEDAAAAAGVVLPPMTAPMGAIERTPSGLHPLATPGRGLTPGITPGVTARAGAGKSSSDFAGAATLDAGSVSAQPAVAVTGAPAPKRRVWAFVAAAVVPLASAVVVFVAIQGKDADRAPEPAAAQATVEDRRVATVDTDGVGTDDTPDEPVRAPAPSPTVTVTLTGLPAGTEVLDPDGAVLTRATGGETRITLPRGTAELKLGLHHAEHGDGYVTVTPSGDVVAAAGALTVPAGVLRADPTPDRRRPDRKRPDRKKPERTKSADDGERDGGPSGTDALELPDVLKK